MRAGHRAAPHYHAARRRPPRVTTAPPRPPATPPCRLEAVALEDGTPITRPVIRLKEGRIVLTRINPADRSTSVIVRVRPGWEELRSFLADAKQR